MSPLCWPGWPKRLLLSLAALGALFLASCMMHEPAQPEESRLLTAAPLDWPQWNSDEASHFRNRIPATIPVDGPLDAPARPNVVGNSGDVLTVHKAAVAGGGVLVDCTVGAETMPKSGGVTMNVGDVPAINYAATIRPDEPLRESPAQFWRALAPMPDWQQLFVAPQEFTADGKIYTTSNPLAKRLQDAKEYATIPSVRPADPPGIVVWFGGIGPSWKMELPTQAAFLRRGFAFVGAMESVLGSFARLRIELQDLPKDPLKRFEFVFRRSLDGLRRNLTRISLYENASEAGTALGKEISASVTASASGAEPIVAWLEELQPALKSRPLIVIGCSGGVPAAMAFSSRHVDRLAGLIIVGGFEDFEQLLRRTDLNGGEPTISWRNDTPLPEQQKLFTEAFSANCTVDPGRLANAIPTDRVLMIQGRFDTLVPADLSDRLWESLGRPERWKFFGGHRLLFYRLSAYSTDLADWAESRAWAFPDQPAWN